MLTETCFPKVGFERVDKGARIGGVKPGDFILVKGTGFFNSLIRFGQGLRYGFKDPDIEYTHVAIVEDEVMLIEATSKGIHRTPIEKYNNYQYISVQIDATDADRVEIVRFAKSAIREKYGWLTVVSVAFCMLTGMKFSVGIDGEEICSGLVGRSLERGTFIPPRDASHLAPIDLVKSFLK